MKKIYENPSMLIVLMTDPDIVTASLPEGEGDDQPGQMDSRRRGASIWGDEE